MRLSLIVAAAENGVIGRGNQLPWHLPADLKHFRSLTLGKPIIMGRRTFDSIGKPLPGRLNIVISRQAGLELAGLSVAGTLQEALRVARAGAAAEGVEEILVIGGAEIYRQTLPLADRIYITKVHAEVSGDTRFPAVDWDQWREIEREFHAADDSGQPDYSFVVYDRATD